MRRAEGHVEGLGRDEHHPVGLEGREYLLQMRARRQISREDHSEAKVLALLSLGLISAQDLPSIRPMAVKKVGTTTGAKTNWSSPTCGQKERERGELDLDAHVTSEERGRKRLTRAAVPATLPWMGRRCRNLNQSV